MSKYYKVEDVLAIFSDEERPLNWTDSESEIQAQNDFDCYKGMIESLPTIEVSEDNEPTWEQVKEYCFKRNFAIVGRETPKEYLRGFAEVSEDCISREWVKGICENMLDEEMLGHMLGYIEDAPSIVPQVPSEDCISRADAVNALIAHFIPQTYTGEQVEQASKLARKIMANAPSVVPSCQKNRQVERAEGEWKWETNDICGNCGYELPHLERIVGETVLMDSRDWKYCPNCGKKRCLE